MSKRITAFLGITLIIGAIPVIGLLTISLREQRVARHMPIGESYYLPPPRVIRAMSFGYNEVIADLLWIRTIAYFTDHIGSDRDLSHIKRYISTILALDDWFKEIYKFGPSMLTANTADQSNDNVLRAIDILKMAYDHYPDDYTNPLRIGTYYMSGLKTPWQKQKDLWRKQGADWIHRAALIGATVSWLPSLAAKIYSEQGQRELAILNLQEVYLVTKDENVKAQIRGKLAELQATQIADRLQEDTKRFDERHQQGTLSFVPSDLFAVISDPSR